MSGAPKSAAAELLPEVDLLESASANVQTALDLSQRALDRAHVARAAAEDACSDAKRKLAAIEREIDTSSSKTTEDELSTLFSSKAVAERRVEHAAADLKAAVRDLHNAEAAYAGAPQLVRNRVVQQGVAKIVALEAKAKAHRAALAALEAEQALEFKTRVVPFQPRWERVTFKDTPPRDHYEALSSVLVKHAGAVAPDMTWPGNYFMTEMDRLHRIQEAHVLDLNAGPAPPFAAAPFASADDFDRAAQLRLRHTLDCLGTGFAHAAGLRENLPMRTLYELAGANLAAPGMHPVLSSSVTPYGDVSGEALGQILHAVRDEPGSVFRRVSDTIKSFDAAAVRRSQGEWVSS